MPTKRAPKRSTPRDDGDTGAKKGKSTAKGGSVGRGRTALEVSDDSEPTLLVLPAKLHHKKQKKAAASSKPSRKSPRKKRVLGTATEQSLQASAKAAKELAANFTEQLSRVDEAQEEDEEQHVTSEASGDTGSVRSHVDMPDSGPMMMVMRKKQHK